MSTQANQQTELMESAEGVQTLSLPSGIGSSDAGASSIFISNYGDNHRYIRDEERWLFWDGRHWKADIKAQALLNNLEDMRHQLNALPANYHLEKIAKNLANQRSLTQIRKYLETRNELSLLSSCCDAHTHLCAFENGVYNTETNQFISEPQSIRSLYLTRRIHTAYDAQASCPKWKEFLSTIFCHDEELASFVQKAVGLSLSGKVLEEKLFFAFGSGANGKTTFFEVLNRIFGDFHREIDPIILLKTKSPDQRLLLENLASLRAIRFATSNELPNHASYNDMAVKQLCSRDEINAKVVYQSVCSFKPTHKLWIRSNHKPKFDVRDGGMLRRICLIPFEHKVPSSEMIERYEDILLREQKGILNWIVEGWKLYQKEGLKQLPSIAIKCMAEYELECDNLKQFIEETCLVDSPSEANANSVKLKDFTSAYNNWCMENKLKGSNSRSLAKELRADGFEVTNGTLNIPTIRGLRLTG